MTKLKLFTNKFFLILFLLFLLLLDSQLSFLINSFFDYHFIVSSQTLLLAALFLYKDQNAVFSVSSFLFIGFIFDSYYLNEVGVVTITLPIMLGIAMRFDKRFLKSPFQTLLVYAVLLFFFNISSFALARIYGWDNTSLSQYITYSLSPTLIFNLLVYLVSYRFLKKLV